MDMQPENQTAAMPALCRAGCGFYGSPATENLCSKCFKDALKRKQDPNRQSVGATLFPASSSGLTSAKSTANEAAEPHGLLNVDKHEDMTVMLSPSTTALTSISAAPSTDDPNTATSLIERAAPNVDVAVVENTAQPAVAKPRNRCEICNKKVGFTGFECRCGGMFCGTHRYSDMHNCQFDYKSLGAHEIKKNNPVIAKEKIQKI